MKAVSVLPEGYQELLAIDLQKNKKLALLVNGLAILIGVVMVVAMHFYLPIATLFYFEELGSYLLRFGVLILSFIAYMILHELVHGLAMKICGTKKVKYGFTGLYAFAGSEEYYDKKSYIFIALAPIVLWGAVLAVVNVFVSDDWFWVVYLVQVINISGAAGDLYVTLKFARLPKDILVRDCGVGMTVYSRTVTEKTTETVNEEDEEKTE